ncbi:MAG: nitrate/sulfonate/bicarbonate transporter periplasmic protein [Rhodospirillales bacterium]|nr:nitrate/sulfonate/bicarbonate transporter periplasmic protein [Rhodospirillales bacterium]
MNPTRRTFLTTAAALAAGAAVPRATWAQAPGAGLTKVKLVSSSPVARPYHSYLYAGVPTGLYAKLGVEPDLMFISGSAASLQLLISGDADLANMGIVEFVTAKKRQPNLPLRMVYCEDYASLYTLVVLEDSPIKSVADLKGKSVGVLSLGSGSVAVTKSMVRQAGLAPGDVDLLAVGADSQALVALKGGRVDALNFYIGSIAVMENLGVKFRAFPAQVPTGCFVASEAFIKRDRAAAVHALQGIALDTIFSQENPKAAAAAYYKMFTPPNGDRDTALANDAHTIERTMAARKHIGDAHLWGGMGDDDWQSFVTFAGPDIGLTAADTKAAYFNDDLIADINKLDEKLAVDAAASARP